VPDLIEGAGNQGIEEIDDRRLPLERQRCLDDLLQLVAR
jgi:hypothetical protein